jgi:hypothetical protein
MRYLFRLAMLLVLTTALPVHGVEVRPLADCSVKVFRDINRSHVWSGKPPDGCSAQIYVEKRPNGIFVTAWNSGRSESGWVRVSFSAAMGLFEVADKKALGRAGRDIAVRAGRIERCLDSIIRVNDPLECRDYATKSYSAGEETGVEYKRSVWLDDDGRHSVVEYAYGDTRAAVGPPADLFSGSALPPGMNLNLHIIDTD